MRTSKGPTREYGGGFRKLTAIFPIFARNALSPRGRSGSCGIQTLTHNFVPCFSNLVTISRIAIPK